MEVKKLLRAGFRFFTSKDYRFLYLSAIGLYDSMGDEEFLKRKYKAIFKEELNLISPQNYNEKLQWLKLYDRDPNYTTMVDKYLVKEYVSNLIGEQYVIPTLGVWDNPNDINFEELPDKFVLKCNHNSGLGMYICKNKEDCNPNKVKRQLAKGLKEDFYLKNREWPYKNVSRLILAEKYMEDERTEELRDYKFFTFNGKVKALFIATNRQHINEPTYFDFFDENYNHLPIINGHMNAPCKPQQPKNFTLMKELAEILACGTKHLRVDFYECNDKVYFGELTFFQNSGLVPFEPVEWNRKFGDWIKIS